MLIIILLPKAHQLEQAFTLERGKTVLDRIYFLKYKEKQSITLTMVRAEMATFSILMEDSVISQILKDS
jgi:hypothetical protein